MFIYFLFFYIYHICLILFIVQIHSNFQRKSYLFSKNGHDPSYSTHLFIITYILHTYLTQFLHTFDSHLSELQFISCTHTKFTPNSYLFCSLLLLFHLLHTPNPTSFHFFSYFTLFFLTKTLFLFSISFFFHLYFFQATSLPWVKNVDHLQRIHKLRRRHNRLKRRTFQRCISLNSSYSIMMKVQDWQS